MSFFASTSGIPQPPPKALGLDPARAATHEHGRPVPYAFGQVRLGVTYLSQPWNLRSEKVKARVGKKKQTVGHNYFCCFAAAVCLGPLDALHAIRMDDEEVWTGPVQRGVDDYLDLTIEGRGALRFYWGTETQGQDSKFAASGIEHPGYRGLVYFIAQDLLLGQNANTPNIEPQQIDGALVWEATHGWNQSEDTRILLLTSRGDTLTDSFHVWTEADTDSYEHLTSSDRFAIRGSLNGALSATGPLVEEDGGIDLSIVSPDKVIDDATFTMALNRLSLLFVGDEVFWAWDPTLVSANRYRWKYTRARYGTRRAAYADGQTVWWVATNTLAPIAEIALAPVRGDRATKWKVQAEMLGVTADLSAAGVHPKTLYGRAYRPLAPVNLRVFGDGVAPSYSAGQDIAVAWDLTSPVRCIAPAAENLAGQTFTDSVKLQVLDPGTGTVKGQWLGSPSGVAQITNSALVTALGGEVSFILRAYAQRGGLDSLTFDQVPVTKV